MNIKLRNKQLLIISSLALLIFVSAGGETVYGQNPANDWKMRQSYLVDWMSSVKTIKCNFSLSKFTNSASRKAKKESWQAALKKNPRLRVEPDDSNYSFSYFWAADQVRWRCDRSRFYPRTGYDFSQYIYNGERYFFFDEYLNRAIVSAQDDQLGFIKGVRSNIWLQLGMVSILTSNQSPALANIKKAGEEVISGRKCSIYKSSYPQGELTLAIDDENHLIVKMKEVSHATDTQGSIIIYQWQKVQAVNGILIPFECKLESYEVNKDEVAWSQTVIFSLKDCEVNKPLDQGYFNDVLRVGTDLEDNVDAPGTITHVGGDISAEAEKVRLGVPPRVPELDEKSQKNTSK